MVMLVEPKEAIDKASRLWWTNPNFWRKEIETKKLGGSKKRLLGIEENTKTSQNQNNLSRKFLRIEEKRGKFSRENFLILREKEKRKLGNQWNCASCSDTIIEKRDRETNVELIKFCIFSFNWIMVTVIYIYRGLEELTNWLITLQN